MTRLLLHIGHGKTGTTTLQTAFTKHATALEAEGVLYPVCGTYSNHRHLSPKLFGLDNNWGRWEAGTGKSTDALIQLAETEWSKMIERAKDPAIHTVLLSSEDLFKRLDDATWRRFRNTVEQAFQSVHIAAYVRHPAEKFLSTTQQNLKTGSDFRFELPYRSAQVLDAYERAFPGSVHVSVYDGRARAGIDILTDFDKRHLGLSATVLTRTRNRRNASVSAEAMAVLQTLQKPHPDRWTTAALHEARALTRCVATLDAGLDGFERPTLRPEVRDAVIRASTELIGLRGTWGLTFPETDYRIVGKREGGIDLGTLRRVEDLCHVDTTRRDHLLRMARKAWSSLPKRLDRFWLRLKAGL